MSRGPEAKVLRIGPVSRRAEEATWPDVASIRTSVGRSIDEGIGAFIDQDQDAIPEEEEEEESLLALIGKHEEIFQGDILAFEIAKLLGENYDDTRDNLSSRGITSNEIHAILASNPKFQEILTNRRRTKLQFVYGKIRSLKRILREIDLEVVSVKWGYETLYSLKKSSTATGKDRETTQELKAEIETLRAQVRRLVAARRVDAKDLRRAKGLIAKLEGQLEEALEDLEEATAQARPGPAPAKGLKSCVDILVDNVNVFNDDEFDVLKYLAEGADSSPPLEYSIKDIENEYDYNLDPKLIKRILKDKELKAKLLILGLKIVKYERPARYALKKFPTKKPPNLGG